MRALGDTRRVLGTFTMAQAHAAKRMTFVSAHPAAAYLDCDVCVRRKRPDRHFPSVVQRTCRAHLVGPAAPLPDISPPESGRSSEVA